MPGCCGQRGNGGQNSQQNKREKCAPISANMTVNKCVPGANAGQNRGRLVSGQHDEEICHGTGERRRDLINQLKGFLTEFDDKPCMTTPPQQGPNALKPLGSYPEYIKKHCQSWIPPNPRPPPITSVPVHEIRATMDYEKMKGQNNEYISFLDATPKPPVPTCDCVKRNGLQDQCPHPMCKPPTAKCRANNPGPCCPPSLGMGGPEAVLGGSKQNGAAGAQEASSQGAQAPNCTEYQDAFRYGQQSNQQMQGQTPSTPTYATTYRQDYQTGNQMANEMGGQPSQQQRMGMNQGMDVICVCQVSSSALKSGKKYLCCPVPQ